jgi:hypothetical protein
MSSCEPQLSVGTLTRSRTETASRSGRGDISLLDEYSCAKIDSIREIAGMERGSRDGRIHGDVLLALVLEVSAHFHGRERTKTPIRPTLVFSRRALAMWDSTSRTGDCELASRQLRCAARSDRDGSSARHFRKSYSEAV